MSRYIVQHAYKAFRDGQLFGPWEADLEIEIEEADAEWINRDSPDTLAPVDDKSGTPAPVDDEPDTLAPVDDKPAMRRTGTSTGKGRR